MAERVDSVPRMDVVASGVLSEAQRAYIIAFWVRVFNLQPPARHVGTP
jgi:hypothetical protein